MIYIETSYTHNYNYKIFTDNFAIVVYAGDSLSITILRTRISIFLYKNIAANSND